MMSEQIEPQTYLALDNKASGTGITALQSVLADTIFLYSLYKKYHWHVQGNEFYQYHLLFDKHAEELLPLIDLVAERIRMLGGRAPGMPAEVQRNKQIDEEEDPGNEPQLMLRNVLQAHERCMKNIRSALRLTAEAEDAGTNDMLASQVLRTHEQQSWFIRSSMRGA